MSYDSSDFIIKSYFCKKTGKYKPQKWVKHYCDMCNQSRTYAPKNKTGLCRSCASIGKEISIAQRNSISLALQNNKNNINLTSEQRKTNAIKARTTKIKNNTYKKAADLSAATKWGINIDDLPQKRQEAKVLKKIAHNMRCQLAFILKKTNGKLKYVSWTAIELKEHLQNMWQPGMSWDNYGRKQGIRCWEIDHIVPLASALNEQDLRKLCHYSNLQPMWADKNWSKGNRLESSSDFNKTHDN